MALISVRVQAAREPAAWRQGRALMGEGESPGMSLAGKRHHGRGDSMLSILLCQAVVILSPALGLERDAGTGGPCSLPGWASPGHTVAEVLDTNTRAHPLSKLETGPLLSCIVNNVVQRTQYTLRIYYIAYMYIRYSILYFTYAITYFIVKI